MTARGAAARDATIGGVIVRVLTARVQSSNAGPFHDLMRQQLPLLHEQEGLLYVKLARGLLGPVEEVALFEDWRDAHAMSGWVGPDIQRPRLLPGSEELIDDLVITHYEALDLDPPPD